MALEHTCTECGAIIPCRRTLKTLDERFWTKVRKGPDCWLWIGSHDQRGYGRLGKPYGADGVAYISAHRLSWILNRGPIPEALGVLHTCDVPECVRPDHLFVGTPAANMADKTAKQRQHRGDATTWRRFPALMQEARAKRWWWARGANGRWLPRPSPAPQTTPLVQQAIREAQLAADKARHAPNATCKVCGVQFHVKPYRLANVVACSVEHQREWQRTNRSAAH